MDYETDQMMPRDAFAFEKWFNDKIGTDLEKNQDSDDGSVYFICLEMNQSETRKVRTWEESLNSQFLFIQDPGHGWLQVPSTLIKLLGLTSKISGYSYVKGDDVFLEEDCDLGLFVAAYHDVYSKDPQLVEKVINGDWVGRSYNRFPAH